MILTITARLNGQLNDDIAGLLLETTDGVIFTDISTGGLGANSLTDYFVSKTDVNQLVVSVDKGTYTGSTAFIFSYTQ